MCCKHNGCHLSLLPDSEGECAKFFRINNKIYKFKFVRDIKMNKLIEVYGEVLVQKEIEIIIKFITNLDKLNSGDCFVQRPLFKTKITASDWPLAYKLYFEGTLGKYFPAKQQFLIKVDEIYTGTILDTSEKLCITSDAQSKSCYSKFNHDSGKETPRKTYSKSNVNKSHDPVQDLSGASYSKLNSTSSNKPMQDSPVTSSYNLENANYCLGIKRKPSKGLFRMPLPKKTNEQQQLMKDNIAGNTNTKEKSLQSKSLENEEAKLSSLYKSYMLETPKIVKKSQDSVKETGFFSRILSYFMTPKG